MGTISLFTKTTVDFALFEKFARFIHEEDPFTDGASSDYYATLNSIIKYKEEASTFENFLSRVRKKHFVLELSIEMYEAFCKKFNATFSKMSQERQDEYRAIETAFVEWKSRLDIQNGLKARSATSHDAVVVTTNDRENMQLGKFMFDGDDEFLKIINPIEKYYWSQRFSYSRKCELPYEGQVASNFIEFAQRRFIDSDFDKDHRLEDEDASHIQIEQKRHKESFVEYDWEVYELHGKKIIRRSLIFSELPDFEKIKYPGFKSYISLGRKEKFESSKVEYTKTIFGYPHYILDTIELIYSHNLVIIENCEFEQNIETVTSPFRDIYTFNFHCKTPNSDDHIEYGHRCQIIPNSIMTFTPVFLATKPSSTNKESYYKEYDLNNMGDIPLFIQVKLLGWEYFNLDPFENAHLTVSLANGHYTWRGK